MHYLVSGVDTEYIWDGNSQRIQSPSDGGDLVNNTGAALRLTQLCHRLENREIHKKVNAMGHFCNAQRCLDKVNLAQGNARLTQNL